MAKNSYRFHRRNDFSLWSYINGVRVSNFKLWEFESQSSGLVVVHPMLLLSLELMRQHLCDDEYEDVQVIITNGTRTPIDNESLAARFGWIDEGGLVSRKSTHLAEHGGIAADFYAKYTNIRFRRDVTGQRIPQAQVATAARQVFDFVKGDYKDGHVHGDNRDGGLKLSTFIRGDTS